ncbi:MAG: FxLYD domain-containing protein [Acidobacteriota bacterium]|nr:FxLYD domain-containing protein [Blastocatellia bacterium]MDW8240312.1 FxLYD domain-containing protein [Acidobacteriota bacterium]
MFESPLESEAKLSRGRSIKIVAITAAVFAVLLAVFLYLNHRYESKATIESEPYRAGSPEFDSYLKFVELEQQDPQGSENLLGQIIVVANAILHNRGDKTLNHVEVRAVVYDAAGNEIAERTARPVPRVRRQLAPGESMLVRVNVDSIPAGSVPAAAQVVLTGLRFKP